MADTMRRGPRYRTPATPSTRGEQAPKHGGPALTADFAKLQGCSPMTAADRLSALRVALLDLAQLAGRNPIYREWCERAVAPLVAACAAPDADDDVQSAIEGYARADAESDVALVRWLKEPSEANYLRFRATLRQERARGAEVEGILEIRRQLEVVK